jgi:glutamine cyclotransferase
MKTLYLITISGIISLLSSCGSSNEQATAGIENNTASTLPAPAAIGYSILNSYPHDTTAFTQGLELHEGKLIESTGLTGSSTLRMVDPTTGKVIKEISNQKDIFAEGVTVFRDTVYQLSWQNHLVLMYRVKDLSLIGTVPWSGEGWGITHDTSSLIISDGTDKLYFVEPVTLKLKRVLSVQDQYGPVNNLNELEIIEGYIYANRWQYDYILKIDPKSGFVVGMMNMKDFLQKNSRSNLSYLKKIGSIAVETGAVLNGIAYDSVKKTILITGKLWPEVFEIKMN